MLGNMNALEIEYLKREMLSNNTNTRVIHDYLRSAIAPKEKNKNGEANDYFAFFVAYNGVKNEETNNYDRIGKYKLWRAIVESEIQKTNSTADKNRLSKELRRRKEEKEKRRAPEDIIQTIKEDTRDLDDLVAELEGPKPKSKSKGKKQGVAASSSQAASSSGISRAEASQTIFENEAGEGLVTKNTEIQAVDKRGAPSEQGQTSTASKEHETASETTKNAQSKAITRRWNRLNQ